MNLLDLAGVAIPAGFRGDGLPFGVTIAGPKATDHALLALAGRLHRAFVTRLGALESSMPVVAKASSAVARGFIEIAVCGAHMEALPLNYQLRDRGGYFVRATRTTPHYRLYALPGGTPRRPGLLRVSSGGASIDVEVWAIPAADLGSFVEGVLEPLGMGKIELEGGARVLGFLCESSGTEDAVDITASGGWRAYLQGSKDASPPPT